MTKVDSFPWLQVTSRLVTAWLPTDSGQLTGSMNSTFIEKYFQADAREALLEMLKFEETLSEIKEIPAEEAVPGEMLALFSEQQWPELLFEFQPSLRFLRLEFDTVKHHGRATAVGSAEYLHKTIPSDWLIFNHHTEVRVRPVDALHREAIEQLSGGINFLSLARFLEKQSPGTNQAKPMLTQWMDEGLIIDVGVPIPDEAVFEEEG